MTMVVQHLENRLALSSENSNGELHEFQIVHALITQCKKPVSSDAEHSKSSSSCGSEDHSPKSNSLTRKSGHECKDDRSSFVATFRQTFNAFAQATNPSLCVKQHPNSIASTVKNIISQFSRQHGSLCPASPSDVTPAPKRNLSQRVLSTRKKTPSGRVLNSSKVKNVVTQRPPSLEKNGLLVPSTSGRPTTTEKAPVNVAIPKQPSVNPVATKPKTRSVRARNAHRLIRHESAPIPLPPGETRSAVTKTSASVRRSKSDAVCYTSCQKRNRRKIESNVQTKVLHFENCCKGKGQASMCVECRKRSLEEEVVASTSPRSGESSTLPKINSARPKQENYMGALSYHKPSIISQNAVASATSSASSIASLPEIFSSSKSPCGKHYSSAAKRPKAVVCPGGTFFLTTNDLQETSSFSAEENLACVALEIMAEPAGKTENVATVEGSDSEQQHDLVQKEELECETAPMQNNGDQSADLGNSSIANAAATPEVMGAASLPPVTLEDSAQPQAITVMCRHKDATVVETTPDLSQQTENLYTLLCSRDNGDKTVQENMSGSSADSLDCKVAEDGLTVALNYDSSDNVDSSSSSGESSSSPRQQYLAQHSRKLSSLRRTPSTRYQKMRRKLKKLITRSRLCPEVSPVVPQSQSELEKQFLESIRIPTPVFMLSKDSSFSARRQQLAMHFDKSQDWMSRLPDHVLLQIFSYLDTRSLAMLKCVCKDYQFLVNSYDARGTDSLWVKDKRYIEDPCRFCRKKFSPGDVSMCRYHAKSYHCDLPYGRSYWMCCFQLERSASGCRTGIHDNYWGPLPHPNSS